MKLTEEDRAKLFKNGEIVKLGNYWIGYDLVYGIHIPTNNREQGESIMKQILKNQEIVERLKQKIEWWGNQPEAWFNDKEWSTAQFYEQLKEILSNDTFKQESE